MTNRPVFAFEASFLDRLTQHYDMCLDPTNSAYYCPAPTTTHDTKQEGSQQHANENHRMVPRSAHRVSSIGSASSSAPGSLSFLRKRNRNTKTSLSPPSTGSMVANSLNCFNSLGSLDSLNSFLKGSFHQMDSLDSVRSVDSRMSGISVFEDLHFVSNHSSVLRSSVILPDLSQQKTLVDNGRDDGRVGVAHKVRSTSFSKTDATARSNCTMETLQTPIPPAANSSSQTAKYLVKIDPEDHESTINQIVRTFPAQTSGTPTEEVIDRMQYQAASSSVAASDKSVPAAHPKKKVAVKPIVKTPPQALKNGTKKRIRRKEPVVRKYVLATEKDILLGRGGGSNHHKGNIYYRKRILHLQPSYKTLDRDEKTAMSEDVVKWVQTRGGRFLKRECKGSPWYIVTDATARQKVSQALREDHTPEGRALKKSRTTFKCRSKKKKRVVSI